MFFYVDTKFDQKDELIAALAKFIDEESPPFTRGRPRKFDTAEMVRVVFEHMHGMTWRQLSTADVHYSSYFARWEKCCKKDLIEKFFTLEVHRLKYCGRIKDSKRLIIDSTTVLNKLGSECVTKDPGNFKHRGTKIHLIATKSGIPLAATITDAFRNDGREMEAVIDKVSISVHRARLLGDKGYIGFERKVRLKRTKGVTLIYPHRVTMSPLTERKLNILKGRKRVEHVFAAVKRHTNLAVRKERRLKTFAGLVFLALSLQLYQATHRQH